MILEIIIELPRYFSYYALPLTLPRQKRAIQAGRHPHGETTLNHAVQLEREKRCWDGQSLRYTKKFASQVLIKSKTSSSDIRKPAAKKFASRSVLPVA